MEDAGTRGFDIELATGEGEVYVCLDEEGVRSNGSFGRVDEFCETADVFRLEVLVGCEDVVVDPVAYLNGEGEDG